MGAERRKPGVGRCRAGRARGAQAARRRHALRLRFAVRERLHRDGDLRRPAALTDSQEGWEAGATNWVVVSSSNDLTRRRLLQLMALTAGAAALPRVGFPRPLVPLPLSYDDGSNAIPPAAAQALRFEEIDASNISAKLGPKATTKDGILTYIKQQQLAGDAARFAEFFLRLIVELPDATDWDLDSLQYWANYDSPYVGFGEGDFPVG